MDSFVFNSFKKRFIEGEVYGYDKWTFNVVNSKFEDYKNVESFRDKEDFIKIGGQQKYNNIFTPIKPVTFLYHEMTKLDNGYNTNKPLFVTNDNWDEFYNEYKIYIDNYNYNKKVFENRYFYGNNADILGFNLHDLFFKYESDYFLGKEIRINKAPFSNFEGFYWVTNKEELAWCADRVNGEIDGVRNETYNNKIAIVLGDDIGTDDNAGTLTEIESCIGKFPDRPFNGLFFGNGFSFKNINLICKNDTNGVIGNLGSEGKLHYIRFKETCKMTCKKKISIEHLQNESTDVCCGLLCGKNYGEILECEILGTLEVNDFVPAVYCVQNKTLSENSDSDPEANIFYPNYMCINSPGNIIPYVGYFNEGVFASETITQQITNKVPGYNTEVDCTACYGTGTQNVCSVCSGIGEILNESDEYETCTACSGCGVSGESKCNVCNGSGTITDEDENIITCTACSGIGRVDICTICKGIGFITEKDETDVENEIECPTCRGTGYSLCPTCGGNHHLGKITSAISASTYSAYIMKQWSKSNGNGLDNTGVKTINMTELKDDELEKALSAGVSAKKGFVTFYDYNQIAQTMKIIGYDTTPNLSDYSYISETEDGSIRKVISGNPVFSGVNGYVNTNASKSIDYTKASFNSSIFTDVMSNVTDRYSLDECCIMGGTSGIDEYKDGFSAMPYSVLDQPMKLNIQSRAAYYVSPLVGMNKATIGNCYINEKISSSGTFVGFIGGAVGKQCGGHLNNITVNLEAEENDGRNIFSADSINEIDPKNSFILAQREVTFDDYTSYSGISFINEPIQFLILQKDGSVKYVKLNGDIKTINAYESDKKYRNVINKTFDKNTKIKKPTLHFPVGGGFNLSLSSFNGISKGYKTVIKFGSIEELEANSAINVCVNDYENDVNVLYDKYYKTIVTDQSKITHDDYSNNVKISNYDYETDCMVISGISTDEKACLTYVNSDKISDMEVIDYDKFSSIVYSAYDSSITGTKEFNENDINHYVIRDGLISKQHKISRLNVLDFKQVSNQEIWVECEGISGVYKNANPIVIPISTYYDDIVYTNKMHSNYCHNKHKEKVHYEDNDETISAVGIGDVTKMNVDIYEKDEKIDTFYPNINNIIIEEIVLKEEISEIKTNDYVTKYGNLTIESIKGITLVGVEYDKENFKRTDYSFYIPELDCKKDHINFIDVFKSYFDEEKNKYCYSDKYTLNARPNEIYKRKDGIYELLNKRTWEAISKEKLNSIFYHKYYYANFNDVNNYRTKLYSIRNIGGLIGSLVIGNKQYIQNNHAFLNNKQGVKFIATKNEYVPKIIMPTSTDNQIYKIPRVEYLNVKNFNGKYISKQNYLNINDNIFQNNSCYYKSLSPDGYLNILVPSSLNGNLCVEGYDSNISTGNIKNNELVYKKDDELIPLTKDELRFNEDGQVRATDEMLPIFIGKLLNSTFINYVGIKLNYEEKVDNYKNIINEIVRVKSFNNKTFDEIFIKQPESLFLNDKNIKEYKEYERFKIDNEYYTGYVVEEYFESEDGNIYYPIDTICERETTNEKDYKPLWEDYSLLNRYGAFAAVCEYHSSNVSDLIEPVIDEEIQKIVRPVELNNNYFAYHEHNSEGEIIQDNVKCTTKLYGPMFLANSFNTISNHVVGHKIYGIASPLIAEIKPVMNSIPSIIKYNNGVYPGKNEFGLFREGKVNQYFGMFTTDMGIRYSTSDPHGYVSNIALDTPGTRNNGINNQYTKILYALDTRELANNLFDWTTTYVDSGNVPIIENIIPVSAVNYADRNKNTYLEPYDIPGQDKYCNDIFSKIGLNFKYDSLCTCHFTWNEPQRMNVNGYGFTNEPLQTITVPYNSFKDILGNTFPGYIYGYSDITRYRDLYDKECIFYSTKVKNSIYRPDFEQVIDIYDLNDGDTQISDDTKKSIFNRTISRFSKYKRKNRYPYFGSSLRVVRDDSSEFIGIPDNDNIRDGKYINDCVPSYIMDNNNKPNVNYNVTDDGYVRNLVIPSAILYYDDSGMTLERFTYTYTTITSADEFKSFEKQITFEALGNSNDNKKIGYWTKSNIYGGFENDYITTNTKKVKYEGNVFNLGYTKTPALIRTEIINSKVISADENNNQIIIDGYSETSGISGNDIQGLLVQDSIGRNVMYINLGLGDCDGLQTWTYSAYQGISNNGIKGLLLEIK